MADKKIVSHICALILATIISACTGALPFSPTVSPTPTPSPSGGLSGTPTPTPTPSPSGLQASHTLPPTELLASDFFVDVVPPAGVTMYLHVDGDWTKPCRAQAGNSNQDLWCIAEVMEEDLYDQGIVFEYNVPPQTCSYLNRRPYFYYQFPVLAGPASVNVAVDASGNKTFTSYAPMGAGLASANLNNAGGVYCSSDFTPNNPAYPAPDNGPNCCMGSYTLTTTTAAVGGGAPTVTASTGQWGGTPSACLNGPGVAATQPKGADGFPLFILSAIIGSSTSVNSNYTVPAPITQTNYRASNVYASNYFIPGAVGGVNDYSLLIPTAMDPAQNYVQDTQPYYQWDCLDEAGDYVNRLRILVRSWSTVAQFNLNSAATNPSLSGPQGVPFSFHDLYNWPTWIFQAGDGKGFGNNYPEFSN